MKKNKITHLTLGGLILIFIVACDSNFLTTQPSQFMSQSQMTDVSKKDPSILIGNLRGIYSTMYTPGSGGAITSHDDFGQKGYDIYSDLLSGDMALEGYNYGWYHSIEILQATLDYTQNENYEPWRYYYRIIFACNSVIDGLGGTSAIPNNEDGKHVMGQAKAMRAYAYFYLANLYANSYDPTAAILPLYTSLSQEAQPLSSTADVYDLITTDLDTAVSYLDGFTRSAKNEVDQSVAQGLLAYAYLTTKKYAQAEAMASNVIAQGNYSLIPLSKVLTTGFNDVSDPSWMWGMDLTADQKLSLASWWGQVDLFTYSYAYAGDPKTMDAGLYSKIRTTDERKKQFVDPYGEGIFRPLYKFFTPERRVGGQRVITTDYVYMRIEEMYLIKAEAEAMQGNDGAAKSTLLELVSQRDTDPTYINTLSGQALKDEIYLQWRIETWGEGKSYLAMKRNKATIVREGHIELNNIPIPYDDNRLTFKIPLSEYQNNPNITK